MEDTMQIEDTAQIESAAAVPIQAATALPMQASIAPEISTESQFNSLLLDLSSIKTLINEMQTKVKLLEKSVIKSNKEMERDKKKNEVKKQPNQPSGFDKPVAISDDMCVFMNKPIRTLVSHPDVAEYAINYIRVNKLQDMTNRKKINPNETLQKLLRLKPDDAEQLTYFNLQKYLNKHFNTSVSQ